METQIPWTGDSHEKAKHKMFTFYCLGFPVAEMIKNLPAMQETWVRSLGREDPPEKGMATHSSILALENSIDRRAWWATVYGVAKSHT